MFTVAEQKRNGTANSEIRFLFIFLLAKLAFVPMNMSPLILGTAVDTDDVRESFFFKYS